MMVICVTLAMIMVSILIMVVGMLVLPGRLW